MRPELSFFSQNRPQKTPNNPKLMWWERVKFFSGQKPHTNSHGRFFKWPNPIANSCIFLHPGGSPPLSAYLSARHAIFAAVQVQYIGNTNGSEHR
jgi:hypothetical protein